MAHTCMRRMGECWDAVASHGDDTSSYILIMSNTKQEALRKLKCRNAGAFPETFPYLGMGCLIIHPRHLPEAILTLKVEP